MSSGIHVSIPLDKITPEQRELVRTRISGWHSNTDLPKSDYYAEEKNGRFNCHVGCNERLEDFLFEMGIDESMYEVCFM